MLLFVCMHSFIPSHFHFHSRTFQASLSSSKHSYLLSLSLSPHSLEFFHFHLSLSCLSPWVYFHYYPFHIPLLVVDLFFLSSSFFSLCFFLSNGSLGSVTGSGPTPLGGEDPRKPSSVAKATSAGLAERERKRGSKRGGIWVLGCYLTTTVPANEPNRLPAFG